MNETENYRVHERGRRRKKERTETRIDSHEYGTTKLLTSTGSLIWPPFSIQGIGKGKGRGSSSVVGRLSTTQRNRRMDSSVIPSEANSSSDSLNNCEYQKYVNTRRRSGHCC